LFADDSRPFQVALVGDNDDRFRVCHLVADGVQQVDGFLIRSSVCDGVDYDVAVHLVLAPRVQFLYTQRIGIFSSAIGLL